jgi:hypothetical protein
MPKQEKQPEPMTIVSILLQSESLIRTLSPTPVGEKHSEKILALQSACFRLAIAERRVKEQLATLDFIDPDVENTIQGIQEVTSLRSGAQALYLELYNGL